MRRVTPSKVFLNRRSESNCCRCLTSDERAIEQNVFLSKKKLPLKIISSNQSHTVSTAGHKDDFKHETLFTTRVVLSPQHKNLSILTKSPFSTQYKTTAETKSTPKGVQQSPLPSNPLEKLNKKSKHKRQTVQPVARKLTWNTPALTFTYFSPQQEQLNPEQIPLVFPIKQKESKRLQYARLKGQVQQYSKQYQSLLLEQSQLMLQKAANSQLYEQLLRNLQLKQCELREASQQRQCLLEQVKKQIAVLLTGGRQ